MTSHKTPTMQCVTSLSYMRQSRDVSPGVFNDRPVAADWLMGSAGGGGGSAGGGGTREGEPEVSVGCPSLSHTLYNNSVGRRPGVHLCHLILMAREMAIIFCDVLFLTPRGSGQARVGRGHGAGD